jgi:hypothetical protein
LPSLDDQFTVNKVTHIPSSAVKTCPQWLQNVFSLLFSAKEKIVTALKDEWGVYLLADVL